MYYKIYFLRLIYNDEFYIMHVIMDIIIIFKHYLLNYLILIPENTNVHVFLDFLARIADMVLFASWTIQILARTVEFAGKYYLVIKYLSILYFPFLWEQLSTLNKRIKQIQYFMIRLSINNCWHLWSVSKFKINCSNFQFL